MFQSIIAWIYNPGPVGAWFLMAGVLLILVGVCLLISFIFSCYANRKLDLNQAISSLDDTMNAADLVECGLRWGRKENSKNALICFNKALRKNPDDALTLYNRAMAYVHLQEREKAVADLERAVEIKPELFEAYIALCEIYSRQGYVDKVLSTYERQFAAAETAIGEYGHFCYLAAYKQALIYEQRSDWSHALRAFRQCEHYNDAMDLLGGPPIHLKDLRLKIRDLEKRSTAPPV